MRSDIKNQYGAVIGFSKEDANRIEYYLLIGGMIGFWDKRTRRYIAIGKGGSGMKAQSDIGVGEVYRLSVTAGKKIEKGNGANMKYILKQKIQGGYKKTEYEITAKALPKLIAYAKRVKADLYDGDGNFVDIENDGKAQMLMAAIKAEWETIQSYEGSLSAFTPEEQAVIKDIITEEKVHIGQFQAMLDNIGKTVTEPITEGTSEGENQLGLETAETEPAPKQTFASARFAAYKARCRANAIGKNVKSAYTSDYDYNYLVTNLDRSSHSYLFKYAIKQVEYWAKYDPDKANRYKADVDGEVQYFYGKVYNGYTRGEVTQEQMKELKEKAKAEGEAVKDYISDLISGTYDSAPFAMVKASRDSRNERNIMRRQAGRGNEGIKEVDDDYDFEDGDIVIWTNDGILLLADSIEAAKAAGATPNGATSYFVYGTDKEVTENFEQQREAMRRDIAENEESDDDIYASKKAKKKVKCSIGEIIEKEILSEDKAKEAYALGFRDAIEKADEVDRKNEEPNFDMDLAVEFDEDDSDSAEQAIYDAGVAEVESYSDENGEFDDDAFDGMEVDDADEEDDDE